MDTNLQQPSLVDQLVNAIKKNTEHYDSLLHKLSATTECLESEESNKTKYEAVVSIEYILLRLRIKLTEESMNVKALLNEPNTMPSMRGVLLKRSEYLSQLSLKLDSIRDDVSVLQKTVYTQQIKPIYS